VFDLDGTLVDSYVPIAESLNHARAAYRLPPLPLKRIRRTVGRGLERLVAELVGEPRVEEGVRLFREHYEKVYRDRTHALPGALGTVRELARRGYRLSVASNKPARFGRAILDATGMLPYLTEVQGPDLAGTTKPEPTMLRNCLAAMSVEPAAAAYVGDMVLDVESAARAGVPVLLVRGGSSDDGQLDRTGERVLDSISALTGVFPG
jgi:phosphoglycolate phosphatase